MLHCVHQLVSDGVRAFFGLFSVYTSGDDYMRVVKENHNRKVGPSTKNNELNFVPVSHTSSHAIYC